MIKNLIIYEKTLELIEVGSNALRQFPKYERFVLVADIRKLQYDILKLIIETNKGQHRKTSINNLDVAHETLRHLVDMAYLRLKYIDQKKYTLWMNIIDEVGRLLGGWMKSMS